MSGSGQPVEKVCPAADFFDKLTADSTVESAVVFES